MPSPIGSRQFRERIVGRTISGVIARPGRDGEPPVVMLLRFEDGGVVEFVSPRSDRLLKDALTVGQSELAGWSEGDCAHSGAQLPLDGLFAAPTGPGTALGVGTGRA